MKTHFKKMQDPNFIGSWDLFDKDGKSIDKVVEITRVDQTVVKNPEGKEDNVMTVHLKGLKPLICNSTNAKSIVKVTGSPFVEDWVGKSITLYVANVRAFGSNHEAIRVRNEAPKPKELPELTPKHPKWDGAAKAVKAGTVTIERLEKTFKISETNKKQLSK